MATKMRFVHNPTVSTNAHYFSYSLKHLWITKKFVIEAQEWPCFAVYGFFLSFSSSAHSVGRSFAL